MRLKEFSQKFLFGIGDENGEQLEQIHRDQEKLDLSIGELCKALDIANDNREKNNVRD